MQHPVIQELIACCGGIPVFIKYCSFGSKMKKETLFVTNEPIIAMYLEEQERRAIKRGECRFCKSGKEHPKTAAAGNSKLSSKIPFRVCETLCYAYSMIFYIEENLKEYSDVE